MRFHTLLAVLDGSASDSRVLDAALTVARSNDARITALYADKDPRDIPAAYLGDGPGLYLSPTIWQELETQIAEQRNSARRHFEDWKQRSGLRDAVPQTAGPTAHLIIELGPMPTLLARHGPVADLILTALPKAHETGKSVTLQAALFDTGRPVLALPDDGPGALSTAAPTAIAWNGRAEAARAVTGALPLLTRGRGDVVVLSIADQEDPGMLAPILDYLAMHGVAARGTTLADRPGGTGALLLEEAARMKAGLLVMGAYTHNRWREVVLGGVTHHVLAHATLPVLFAH